MNESATDLLRDKAVDLRDDLKELGGQLKNVAQEKIGAIGDKARDYYTGGKEQVLHWEESAAEYIRERPFRSLFIAMGAGALLCMFLRRR